MQLQIEIDRKAVGRRLRAERRLAGHTQETLAEKIGVTSKYVSRVENGSALPSLPYVIRFSEVTGCDLNHLLRGIMPNDTAQRKSFGEKKAAYGDPARRLSDRGRRICDEVMNTLIGALEESEAE